MQRAPFGSGPRPRCAAHICEGGNGVAEEHHAEVRWSSLTATGSNGIGTARAVRDTSKSYALSTVVAGSASCQSTLAIPAFSARLLRHGAGPADLGSHLKKSKCDPDHCLHHGCDFKFRLNGVGCFEGSMVRSVCDFRDTEKGPALSRRAGVGAAGHWWPQSAKLRGTAMSAQNSPTADNGGAPPTGPDNLDDGFQGSNHIHAAWSSL
jgi:hypothetical protein